jgi:ubiquinone/menaquinone biosynthesis C-methylase UbiE
MSDPYFERIWTSVPHGATPEHFVLRRDFLLAHVAAGERVLDAGCGEGAFSAALAAAGALPVGVDVAVEPLRRARERNPGIAFELAGRELPFADGTFDAVWAAELLEHVQDVPALLAELARVLRSGGRLLVTTPDHPLRLRLALALRRRAFEEHFDPRSDHVRFFTARTLATLITDAAFGEPLIRSRSGVLLARAPR